MSLAQKSYAEVGRALRDEPDARLLELLDSPSIKIGDTAADFLGSRGRADLVAQLLREKKIRTRTGKIRSLNTLGCLGRKFAPARDIFVQYLEDRSREVAHLALFYLTLWGDRSLIPKIQACENPALKEDLPTAVRAISERDHRIFTPSFRADERWEEEANSRQGPLVPSARVAHLKR